MPRHGHKWWTPERCFWPKVEIKGSDDCWIWKGGTGRGGYGKAYDGKLGVTKPAHVLAWELYNNRTIPINKPYGLHTCDTPSCCNPNHIKPGTQAENMQDMMNKGRNKSNRRANL